VPWGDNPADSALTPNNWLGKGSLRFYIPKGAHPVLKHVVGGICAIFDKRVTETGVLSSTHLFRVYRGDDKSITVIDKVYTLKYIVTNEAVPVGP
jgi:hypothetical protein